MERPTEVLLQCTLYTVVLHVDPGAASKWEVSKLQIHEAPK